MSYTTTASTASTATSLVGREFTATVDLNGHRPEMAEAGVQLRRKGHWITVELGRAAQLARQDYLEHDEVSILITAQRTARSGRIILTGQVKGFAVSREAALAARAERQREQDRRLEQAQRREQALQDARDAVSAFVRYLSAEPQSVRTVDVTNVPSAVHGLIGNGPLEGRLSMALTPMWLDRAASLAGEGSLTREQRSAHTLVVEGPWVFHIDLVDGEVVRTRAPLSGRSFNSGEVDQRSDCGAWPLRLGSQITVDADGTRRREVVPYTSSYVRVKTGAEIKAFMGQADEVKFATSGHDLSVTCFKAVTFGGQALMAQVCLWDTGATFPLVGTVVETETYTNTRREYVGSYLSNDEYIRYPGGYEYVTTTTSVHTVRLPGGHLVRLNSGAHAIFSAQVQTGVPEAVELATLPLRVAGALPCSSGFDARVKAEAQARRQAQEAQRQAENAARQAAAERAKQSEAQRPAEPQVPRGGFQTSIGARVSIDLSLFGLE